MCVTFKSFHNMIVTQYNANLRILRSNNGGRTFLVLFFSFFDESSIIHQTTCLGSPEKNGVAKHKNKHFLEIARVIMFTMNVPKTF